MRVADETASSSRMSSTYLSIELLRNNFTGNSVADKAMIVLSDGDFSVTIDSCRFHDNVANSAGILNFYNTNLTAVIINSLFDGNYGWAGAVMSTVANAPGSRLQHAMKLDACTFTNNVAWSGGSVFSADVATGTVDMGLTISDCLFTGNSVNSTLQSLQQSGNVFT